MARKKEKRSMLDKKSEILLEEIEKWEGDDVPLHKLYEYLLNNYIFTKEKDIDKALKKLEKMKLIKMYEKEDEYGPISYISLTNKGYKYLYKVIWKT